MPSEINLSEAQRSRPLELLVIPFVVAYGFLVWFYQSPWGVDNSPWREVVHWTVGGVLAWRFWQGWQVASTYSVKSILGWGAFLTVFAILMPPTHSTDVFGYINRGWQQLHYGANPYVTVIDQIPNWGDDPMITDHWVTNPCPYGFGFALWAKWLCRLAQRIVPGELGTAVLVFKVINAAILWLSAACLAWGVKSLKGFNASESAYLILWNPVLLLHHVANGHNDILLGLGVLLAGLVWLRGWYALALPALTAGFLMKYASAVCFPAVLMALVKARQWKHLAIGTGVSCLLVAVIAGPYLVEWNNFQFNNIATNAGIPVGSIWSAWSETIGIVLKPIVGWMTLPMLDALSLNELLYPGFVVLSLSAMGLLAIKQPFKESEELSALTTNRVNVWAIAIATLMVLVTVLSKKYYPWYVGMFFAGACCLPTTHLVRRWAITLCLFQMFGFTFLGRAHVVNAILMLIVPTAIVFGPWVKQKLSVPQELLKEKSSPLIDSTKIGVA